MNIVVGVSDMQVSNDPKAAIITYSLGSCIGLTIYDNVARVGGIAHYMLPDSTIDTAKAKDNPYMFANTCIPLLFKSAYKLGAKKQRLRVLMVGGSKIMDQNGFFNIGNRNYMAARKMLWKNNVVVDYENVGGSVNRTIKLFVKSGQVKLKVSGGSEFEI